MRLDNIGKSYLYTFLASFSFSEAIWVLFLAHRGMTLVEIGLLESIFHLTSLAMEVPTGLVADRFGRKTSRILSRLAAMLSATLMVLGHSFGGFAAAFVCSALGYNLESGAGDALVYDTLVDEGREGLFMKIKGRLEFAYQGARGLALVAGGFVAGFSYELAYAVAIGIHGLGLATACTFEEPKAGRVDAAPGLVEHCRRAFRTLRATRGLLLYVFFIETFSLFYATLYFYFQAFLKAKGYREGLIGLVLAVATAAGVVMSTRAHRIEVRLGRTTLVSLAPLGALLAFGLIAFTPLEAPGLVLLAMTDGLLYVVFSDYINRLIPSESRATLLSFEAMAFSGMMVVFFPLMGALAQRAGFKATFMAVFGAEAVLLFVARHGLLKSLRASANP